MITLVAKQQVAVATLTGLRTRNRRSRSRRGNMHIDSKTFRAVTMMEYANTAGALKVGCLGLRNGNTMKKSGAVPIRSVRMPFKVSGSPCCRESKMGHNCCAAEQRECVWARASTAQDAQVESASQPGVRLQTSPYPLARIVAASWQHENAWWSLEENVCDILYNIQTSI